MTGDKAKEDPFSGLVGTIREQAARTIPPGLCLGTVKTASPLVIVANGMDLDRDDLMVAWYLMPGWRENLTEMLWPVTSQLPAASFTGTCKVTVGSTEYTGTVQVSRPAESVTGSTDAHNAVAVSHVAPLAAGDAVLLMPDSEGQTYYVLAKVVRPV